MSITETPFLFGEYLDTIKLNEQMTINNISSHEKKSIGSLMTS